MGMYMGVSACVRVCSRVEASDQCEVSSLIALHYVLRQGLSLYLDLIGSAAQVGQQAPPVSSVLALEVLIDAAGFRKLRFSGSHTS